MFKKVMQNIFLATALSSAITSYSKEGMWIPATLATREQDMKFMGLQIPVAQLYNTDGTGYNNAVVLFGRGCTGEVISSKGLILTNHHCGYGSAQRLSSPDKDYFKYGFWANNSEQELPCPGLTVTFIRKMENVTDRVVVGINDTLPDKFRDSMAMLQITKIEAEYKKATGMDATIKPFYQGNQYWVIISETYNDIRLVGFPPNGIGAFGGDDENWMWPRHTGDFSLFRVYADSNNKPAPYAKSNKPYSPGKFFNINTSGYKEGDFTMVYGFPGTTDEYAYSGRLKHVYSIIDPIDIEARTLRLNIWKKHMNADRSIFLKYTAKYAGVANGWKKWQGELLGLKANNVIGKKNTYEASFQKWADNNKDMPYVKGLLGQMKEATKSVDSLIYLDQLNKEAVMGVEIIQQASVLDQMLKCYNLNLTDSALQDTLKKVAASAEGFYKNYDPETDKEVFKTLMEYYFKKANDKVPSDLRLLFTRNGKNYVGWAKELFDSTIVSSYNHLKDYATKAKYQDRYLIMNDPAFLIYNAISKLNSKEITPVLGTAVTKMKYLNRLYLNAQMHKDNTKSFYPDANLTLRVAYGKIDGLDPEGPAKYSFQTTLDDVVALDDTTKEIFRVPQKLKDLHKKKDYGRWGVNGKMPVAFIASNHTSGGNSGSPVLNGKGELIGTNFDRAYEGTMSDYYFDMKRCRNISVDIRYTLFIIEKFGNAGWLIDEMNIVSK